MVWKGEKARHSVSRRGIRTTKNKFSSRGYEMTQDEKEQYVKREVEEFQRFMCPFGYLDIQSAIQHLHAYGKNEGDLEQYFEEYVDSIGLTSYDDITQIDITAIAYDSILQEVRNKIDETIGFDIMNDAEFYTYGNYMASSYDFSEKDVDLLKKAIKKAKPEQRQILLDDEMVSTFLSDELGM